jgi:hypothetical protein
MEYSDRGDKPKAKNVLGPGGGPLKGLWAEGEQPAKGKVRRLPLPPFSAAHAPLLRTHARRCHSLPAQAASVRSRADARSVDEARAASIDGLRCMAFDAKHQMHSGVGGVAGVALAR